LPDNTGHHEVVAGLLHGGSVAGGGGNASSGSLEDEGEQVAEDEDPRIVFGADAREVVADLQDDVLERKVDSGGLEGRCDDQAADLNVETSTGPRVAVEHDATNIAWTWVSYVWDMKDEVLLPRASPRDPKNSAIR